MSDTAAPRRVTAQTEPFGAAQLVHLVLGALVAVGWVSLDDVTLSIVASAAAGVLSVAAQLWARRRATPLADPRSDSGRALVPVGIATAAEPPPDVGP